ncbi:MAG: hypothetical protein AB7K52_05440 [Phycisphaerales bacterium]
MCYEPCEACPITEIVTLPVQHPGVTALVLASGGAALVAAAAAAPLLRTQHCSACGYDLRGTSAFSPQCPECGALGTAARPDESARGRGTRARMIAIGVAMLIGAAGFGAMALLGG